MPRPPVAVLIPAHNEEVMLAATLSALKEQLQPNDRVLVIADNCTDGTAAIAKAAGVEVLERADATCRGKGYALAAGVKAITDSKHEVVVFLDADCKLQPASLDSLARQVAATKRPAQAVYLMEHLAVSNPREDVSGFAFLVKNLVRPLGLSNIGWPVQITGSGFAVPRAALDHVNLASGNIVEDMQLGLDLALAGLSPRLCPDARVIGQLPQDPAAAMRQRQRWEHGHMRTILHQAPRLALLGLLRGRPGAIALAIDLLVPPLSLLVTLLLVAELVTGVAVLFHASYIPAAAIAVALLALVFTLAIVWARFGRERLPAKSLIGAIGYILWKLPMYGRFVTRPQTQWLRTDRTPTPTATPLPPSST